MEQSPGATNSAGRAPTNNEILHRSRDVPWYSEDVPKLSKEIQEVFEKYSKIAPEKVDDHIYQLREKAWDIHPFTCIGSWLFLDLVLCYQPQYAEILTRLQKGDKFLDMGCCFGQEVRRLIVDGAPAESLYGVDFRQEYLDLGYDLFLDRGTCQSKFVAANALASEDVEWAPLLGTLSVIYTGAFFHCFGREDQFSLAKLVARLLRPEAGSMVLGKQVGDVNPGPYDQKNNKGGVMYRHDVASWQQLWDEVGKELGGQWRVEGELRLLTLGDRVVEGSMRELYFCIRRL